MKWFVLTLGLFLISSAQADLLGSIKNRLGVGPYTTPMDALGIFRTGTCEAQLDVFRNTPKRTYKWMSQADQASSDYLDALSSVVTPECAQRLAYHMAYVMTKHGKSDTRRNNRRGQAAARSLERLLNMAGNNSQADSYLSEVRSCFEPPRRSNPIQDIINDVTPVIRRSDNCSPITADRVKVVSGIQGNISNAYGIRRNANGGYDVLLNYTFRPMSVTRLSGIKAGEHVPTPTEMMARTRACFAEAAPFLKGPGGETLNFQALTPTEVNALPRDQRPPEWSIDIVEEAQRGHNRAYSNRFGCDTIIHETLHVLGLCDEYLEKSPYLRGICRVTSMPNTIMNQLSEAYPAATNSQYQCPCDGACRTAQGNPDLWKIYTAGGFPNSFSTFHRQFCRATSNYRFLQPAEIASAQKLAVTATTSNSITFEEVYIHPQVGVGALTREWSCSCSGVADGDCPRAISEMTTLSRNISSIPVIGCPQGATPINSQVVPTIPAGPNDQVSGGILTRYRSASQPSLLAPAHFNRIINGLCERSNSANYAQCAEWAYKERPADRACSTGPDAAGNPSTSCLNARANETCSDRPSVCNDPNFFLGL